jgi:hypothetical protein
MATRKKPEPTRIDKDSAVYHVTIDCSVRMADFDLDDMNEAVQNAIDQLRAIGEADIKEEYFTVEGNE